MKKLSYLLLFVTFYLYGASNVAAQKFGYINSAQILSEHPDVKVADSELEALQKQYSERIQTKYKGLESKIKELQTKYEAGDLTPKAQQEQMQKLREQDAQLQQEEQQLQQDLLKKREQLYQPILDSINEAIQSLAKEGGYTYIFDASQGSILYADETQDLGNKLKSKLGF